jgi:hypothetical protein
MLEEYIDFYTGKFFFYILNSFPLQILTPFKGCRSFKLLSSKVRLEVKFSQMVSLNK